LNLLAHEIIFFQNKVANERDEQSYKKLFLHFHPLLYRFSYNICRNKCVSEEVVSDVFMKIWLMETKLTNVQDLRLFLMVAVKNATLTALSSNKHSLNLEIKEESTYYISDKAANPEQTFIFSESLKQVNLIIASLPTKCQIVFRLIKEERLSYKAVSKIMNISQNTIETHMRIALKKIRNALKSA